MVVADYRSAIIPVMRRFNVAVAMEHKDPDPADVQKIMTWLEANREMSERCRAGACGHGVD